SEMILVEEESPKQKACGCGPFWTILSIYVRTVWHPLSVLRISSAAEKPGAAGGTNDGAATEFEPSSVCLDKLVQNFIEENNDKPSAAKFGRKCNCFNASSNDSSDDEFDFSTGFSDSVTSSLRLGIVRYSSTPYTRITPAPSATIAGESDAAAESTAAASESEYGELGLIFADKTPSSDLDLIETKSSSLILSPSEKSSGEEEKPLKHPMMMTWQPPAVEPKSCDRRTKVVVPGLAYLLREKS
ncbi:hypothetical protein HAX54_002967, partial [Datura stramonium]|nr:hypothetical protein [Datura stramonium]